ncbi:flagellar hook capping FlgD N-terminal domain-containing protein [Saccharibacillus sp. JS10]|uniref:flagellar hook capping FlgD N-terminal domain-containing protein n=1 Tax=Saccharibacillus sp. JS10 TaxID=2950552 RepID=UPI002109EAC7|nr:flagellar hook capping FlgD N-terminal domain-containing protein [Saccharibacillus sp. JS10]MCQ4087192.1 flagellar hook capping protein [Saccharibacillus sp. JS10]
MANNNVSTTNIWPNYSAQNVKNASAKETKDTATMGKEQFLTILIAQLKNQDPLTPMDNSQFTAQMAQFSSLEQLMNMSSQLTQMNASMGTASQLIGQKITWFDTETKNYLTGDVTSVLQKDGKMYAAVGKYLVPTADITVVEPSDSKAGTTSPISTDPTDKTAETKDNEKSVEPTTSQTTSSQSSTEEETKTDESVKDGGVQ